MDKIDYAYILIGVGSAILVGALVLIMIDVKLKSHSLYKSMRDILSELSSRDEAIENIMNEYRKEIDKNEHSTIENR